MADSKPTPAKVPIVAPSVLLVLATIDTWPIGFYTFCSSTHSFRSLLKRDVWRGPLLECGREVYVYVLEEGAGRREDRRNCHA